MPKSNELIPEAGHKDVPRRVFALLDQVVSDKESLGLEQKWLRHYELGKNKHWRKESNSLNLTSANFIGLNRRRTINTLTDNNPTFNIRRIIADEDTEDRFTSVLRAVEYWWNETEQQDILELSVHNGETYGICIEKIIFDMEKEYGIGEVDTVCVDPYNFGLYPIKCSDIQKAQAAFHYFPMSVRDIKRRFGDAADKVVPDSEISNSLSEERRYVNSGDNNTVRSDASTSFGGVLKNLVSLLAGGNANDDGDEALVVECWVKDYSDDKEGNYVYPGNIRVITVVNGSIVLSDKANPSINPRMPLEMAAKTYLYDKFPFAKANSNKDPVNFWGDSDIEQLKGLQMEIDKALSQYSTLKDKVAGVKYINPKTSGVHSDQIVGGASVLEPTNANHGMGWDEPPPIPKELMESVQVFKELFFAIAGTFDLEQANTPGSQVIAYKAIAALLERASTMMRGKIRNYSKLVRDRGRMAVSMMQNWYTEDRMVVYTENGDENVGSVIGQDMIVPLKLTVVSGSTMPRSDVQKREESLTLYDKGAIDSEELLKSIDWPRYDEVIRRMNNGPISEFLGKMVQVGMPEEMMEYLNTIANTDPKKVERMLERGELPAFTQVFAFEGLEPDVKKELEIERLRSEIGESQARITKLTAEADKTEVVAEKEYESIRQTDERIKNDRAAIAQKGREKETKDAPA